MIEEFSGLMTKIRKSNEEIENELRTQSPMINSLDRNVERTNNKLTYTNSRLDKYLQKSSNFCLFTTIIIEIIIVVLLFISL
jgi:hypothetical protein